MATNIDVLIITAANGEDKAVLKVDDGALGKWEKIPGPDDFGFDIWACSFSTPDGKSLRFAVTRSFQMGVEAAGHAATMLASFFKPRCLAMSGVCAGRPDWMNLGDVVFSDGSWRYDVGEIYSDNPGRKPDFKPDAPLYPIRPQWKQAAENFKLPTKENLLKQRPVDREIQSLWLLKQLVEEKDPFRDPYRLIHCADWEQIIQLLENEKRIVVGPDALELTPEGKDFYKKTILRKGQFPEPPVWATHVGPMGTGSSLRRDVDVWPSIEQQQRLARGFDMEASVIGMTALVMGIPYLVVKGVMDFGTPDRNYGFRAFAARAAAEVLIAFLRDNLESDHRKQILKPNTWTLPEDPSPATLLNARYRVIDFCREICQPLWDNLKSWCDSSDPNSVRLITGPGGSGKTRFAIEFADMLREEGWDAGFLPDSTTPEDFAELLSSDMSTFVIIDYAETRPELLELLKAVVNRTYPRKLRVILLAREVADWWDSIQKQDAEVGEFLKRTLPSSMQSVSLEKDQRPQLFEQACLQFAGIRKKEIPEISVDLRDDRFEQPLYIQMAALSVVENSDPDPKDLLDSIVEHEQHYWDRRFSKQYPEDHYEKAEFLEEAARSVAVFTLRGGADNYEQALEINSWAKGPENEQWLRFLENLYPGKPSPHAHSTCIGSLEPDLLGEQLVVRVLSDSHTPSTYLSDILRDNDNAAIYQSFVVLGRISLRNNQALQWMQKLLSVDVEECARAAFMAALTLGEKSAFGELGRLLASRLEVSGTVQVANVIVELAPIQTVSLNEVCVWAVDRILQELPVDSKDVTTRVQQAHLLRKKTTYLNALGRHEDALASINQALDIYRESSDAISERYYPDLALSLKVLSVSLSKRGKHKDALDAIRESVKFYRILCRSYPEKYLLGLANSINQRSNYLSDVGSLRKALSSIREAVKYYVLLKDSGHVSVLPELAMGLDNLGSRFRDLGCFDEALVNNRKATTHFRVLVQSRPDAYLPGLAGCLHNQGICLFCMRRYQEAYDVSCEALDIFRRLSVLHRESYLPGYALSLNSVHLCLSEMERHEEALASILEVVDVYRELSKLKPEAYLSYLAGGLNNLSTCLSKLGEYQKAEAPIREAVNIRRELALSYPEANLPELAGCLNNLSNRLSDLGKHKEALDSIREAVRLYLPIADKFPRRYLGKCQRAVEILKKSLQENGIAMVDEPLIAQADDLFDRLVLQNNQDKTSEQS